MVCSRSQGGLSSSRTQLDPHLDVAGNVMAGLADIKGLLDEFEAVNLRFSEPMSDSEMDALIEKQTALQEKIDILDAWDLDRKGRNCYGCFTMSSRNHKVDSLWGKKKNCPLSSSVTKKKHAFAR